MEKELTDEINSKIKGLLEENFQKKKNKNK